MISRPIVVASDFSDAARPALDLGVELGRLHAAPVHLLNVALMAEASMLYPLFAVTSDKERLYRKFHEAAEEGLETALEGLEPKASPTPVVRHATSAAAGVLDYLEEVDAALLVMGTHGRRGFRRWLMGSVTEEVLRRVERPVLCCPKGEEEIGERRGADAPVHRIVAAIDFSDASENVVVHAVKQAQQTGASVELLHVVPDPLVPITSYMVSGLVEIPPTEEIKRRAQIELDKFAARQDFGGVSVSCSVATGKPWQALLSAAMAQSAGMIVIASRTSALETAFLGSVTHGVLRNSECPVLVVPLPESP